MKKNLLAIAAGLLVSLGNGVCAETGARAFDNEIALFALQDEIFDPGPCQTLFVGSSSIRFWFTLEKDFPNLDVIRRGYGGSTIADTNFYFDKIVAKYHPRAIVFYAGENDLHNGLSPEEVLEEFQTFLKMKDEALGETPVFLVSVKPSIARLAELSSQTATNALFSKLAEEREDLVYIDVASAMMQNGAPKTIFISDDLHMTRAGYDIWREIIGKALNSASTTQAPNCK